MNRPFYAFGVLMAFLALAMLAIGLSSRPSGQQPSAAGSSSGLLERQAGVTLYVSVLADGEQLELAGLLADDEAAGSAVCGLATDEAAYAGGVGLDRTMGDVFEAPSWWHGLSIADSVPSREGLQSTTIALTRPIRLDGLELPTATSGHDAAYDCAMSAALSTFPRLPETGVSSRVTEAEEADSLVLLFESLVRSESPRARQKSDVSSVSRWRWEFELQAVVLGAQNRLWQWAVLARLDDDWHAAARASGLVGMSKSSAQPGPNWAEYTDWIGSKLGSVALRGSPKPNTAAFWRQPNDRLMQIAVAGLNRVAELLHELVGKWLKETAGRIAQRVVRLTPAGGPK